MGSETLRIAVLAAINVLFGSPKWGNELYHIRIGAMAISKGRPRAAAAGHFYTPARTREFEKLIKELIKPDFEDRSSIACPIKAVVLIEEPVPKSYNALLQVLARLNMIYPKRGDTDNKLKAITDAMNGVAYEDDNQLKHVEAVQRYGDDYRITVSLYKIGLSEEEVRQVSALIKGKTDGPNGGSPKMGGTGSTSVSVQPQETSENRKRVQRRVR